MKLSTRTLLSAAAIALAIAPMASAQDRAANGLFAAQDVPVRIGGEAGEACVTGRVEQRVSRGDDRGFGILPVFSGPGEDYAPVDTVRSGELAYGCQTAYSNDLSAQWIGVIYGPSLDSCGVEPQPGRARNYSGTCRYGWINATGFTAFQSEDVILVGSADDSDD
ncbi:hypothetical protein [Maricaulis sp.]|uniref:hypothetical protein n=1 Tax=unclassified Maricaulis TaxID=2632371 RepID=UPI001B2493CE|nr:hypothetical protein [Maricaulis sp.]MBO6798157.1 hypothetical protein [Maricaulis sp.]